MFQTFPGGQASDSLIQSFFVEKNCCVIRILCDFYLAYSYSNTLTITIVCDKVSCVAMESLYPVFEVRTKLKFLNNLKKEIPFYRIKYLFKVEEDSNTGEV